MDKAQKHWERIQQKKKMEAEQISAAIVKRDAWIMDAGEFIMDFGTAIDAMKDKRKVARKGWNGKGMFLYYVPAGAYAPCTDIAKSIVNKDGLVEYGAYIAMKTAQGNVVPWLASQTDMLAEDWMIVE